MSTTLQIGPLTHALGTRTLVMGILNVTPDSFSDGALHQEAEAAEAHARRMIAEGADIIDVGGESTRPGATEVPAEEELQRVLPTLARLRALDIAVTIDTYKADVAAAAIGAGAHAINDVWGLQRDPDMAAIAAQTGVPVVVMHNRHEADDAVDILADIEAFFARSLEIAEGAGIARDRIMLDPGIGFGKTARQNLVVLKRLAGLKAAFGLPMLVGASRKRFIGALTGRDAPLRGAGSVGAHVLAAANGADIIRAHDVSLHVDALKVADAIHKEGME